MDARLKDFHPEASGKTNFSCMLTTEWTHILNFDKNVGEIHTIRPFALSDLPKD